MKSRTVLSARWAIVLTVLLVAAGCSWVSDGKGSAAPKRPTSSPAIEALRARRQLVYDEEFVGPFPSWKNVRDFGARGDGKSDDTEAIQRALDAMRSVATNSWSVLYFPAGTYRITRTLHTRRERHEEYLGASVVGEDPQTSIVRWDGPRGDDMFRYDGWYTKISRLTFDGAGKARIGLYRGDAFSTYSEISDLVFQDLEVGLQLGGAVAYGQAGGQAEHAILRNTFRRCSKYGLHTADWNSLDVWVWFSRFEDCGHGLFNSAGNFHAWGNVFLRSRAADIGSANLSQFSFVGNTSVGSRAFIDWTRAHQWGAQVLIMGNQLYESAGGPAIVTGSAGPFIIIDNIIRNRVDYDGPSISLASNDQILVGNQLTSIRGDAVDLQPGSVHGATRLRRLHNVTVDRGSVGAPDLTLPPTPLSRARKLFELHSGATGTELQTLINSASREPPGSHPIVHLPRGSFSVEHTVTVPAGSDLQLVGDGASEAGSVLRWTGHGTGPILVLAGPSRATVRDLALVGDADGLRIAKADQDGGRIFADQLNSIGGADPLRAPEYGVRIDGIDRSDVTLSCLNATGNRKSVVVRGGEARARGDWTGGQTSVLMGATAHAGILYDVQDGGQLVVASVWYEGRWPDATHIDLSSFGSLTLAMIQLAAPVDASNPLIRIHNYRGQFSMIGSHTADPGSTAVHRWELDGSDGRTSVLSLGNSSLNRSTKPADLDAVWVDHTRSPARTLLMQSSQYGNFEAHFSGFPELSRGRRPGTKNAAAILDGLRALRETRFEPPNQRAAGTTDVRLHRVMVRAGPGRSAFVAQH